MPEFLHWISCEIDSVMSAEAIEVAVLIVCYNGRTWLEDCLNSVQAATEFGQPTTIVVVDNASTDGSLEFVATTFPAVVRVPSTTNLGFAGGCNLGWEYLCRTHPRLEYLLLLNQDTIIEPNCLRCGMEFLRDHPLTACLQPKLLLISDRSVFNTAGNRSHYLGFGFLTGLGERDTGQYDRADKIDFASGAALLVRAAVLAQVGLFDPEFFMYLEDVDLAWKIRQLGLEIRRLPEGSVYHAYHFDDAFKHYYYLEKNRLWLLLVYYKWRTLFLLLPALCLMEAGQWVFCLQHGLLRQRIRIYGLFLQRKHRARLWSCRRATQGRRTIDDREFLRDFVGAIDFGPIQSPLVRYLASPLLSAYWALARRFIRW